MLKQGKKAITISLDEKIIEQLEKLRQDKGLTRSGLISVLISDQYKLLEQQELRLGKD